MAITLTGFMGCGKSSVGRRLSELLSCAFVDLDCVIEDRAGCTIPEIFTARGEAEFRRMEVEALMSVLESSEETIVLALGGGTVMTEECAEMVHKQTLCIYLRASVDTLMEHLSGEENNRPLLARSELRERIETLMSLRSSTYEKTAHIIIDTDGKTISGIAEEILRNCL